MAKYSNVVEYNIVTDVDTSGITKLQNELVKLKQSLKFDKDGFNNLGFNDTKIDQSIKKVNQLQNALTAAFNPKIGTLDLGKLNASLQKEHTNLQMIVKDWEAMGARGNMAISSLSNALLSMNKGAVTVNSTLSKIANTFGNTVRWGITASIFQEMMSSVQGAVSYMKDLDESLTQIQMVTNSSKENMRELAQYANNAAQALGSTTTDYTNAVKVFVQEGFSESESKQYANLSTKLANVSEQNTATTSDQITAFRNAFQLDYQQTVEAMDKVANVANNTASNVNELMTASQRAASVAQAVGSSQDSFLAAIATIESVTRQSAEEIGNGLKTIYQRFADIKTGKSLEDGVEYGQYANALKSIGVDVLDAAGEFKGMDQILKETQEVWSSLSETMKVAVGEKVAGKFQYNRFAALMNNQAYYEKALAATGEGSEGMMDQMNEIYMDSIEGRLKTLQAAGEQVMSTLFNQDDIEPVIETLTGIVNAINDIVDAAGGLQGVLPVIGGLLLRTFSSEIAGSITNMATSIQMIVANSRNAQNFSTAIDLMGIRGTAKDGSLNAKLAEGVADNYGGLSESTREKLRDLSQQLLQLEEEKSNVLQEQETFIQDILDKAFEEQRLAKETLQEKKEKLDIDEDTLLLMKEDIEILESQKVLQGSLSNEQEDNLKNLKEIVSFLENDKTLYDDIIQKCNEYNAKLAEGKNLTGDELEELKKWRDDPENNIPGISIDRINATIEKAEQIEKAEENANATVEDTLEATDFEGRVNKITKIIGHVTTLAFGVSMVTEAVKVLTDESATAEEKFNAIFMNGLMGISMILPTILEVTKALKGYFASVNAVTIAEKARAIATSAANAAMAINPVILGIIAAIAVAALAIAAAYDSVYGAVNRANAEFEKQKEILTQTKDGYEALSEKVEDLDTKMKSISDNRQSLSEIAKGTEEWKDKVAELNDQVYELLETYPELIEYVKSEGGALFVDTDSDGYKEYIANLRDQKLQARQTTLLQQGNVKKAENNKQWEEFKLKYGDFGFTLDDVANRSINDLTNSLDSSKNNYDNTVIALKNLKQSVDTANIYLNNIDDTASGSLGYANYAGTKLSDYENVDLSQYKTTTNYAGQYYNYDLSKWNIDDNIKQALEQYYADKNITDITSNDFGGISFKYEDEENKWVEKTINNAEIEQIVSSYLQTVQYTTESLEQNKKIFELFGARFDPKTKEITDSAGNLITSLNQLDTVTQEQAAAMSKLEDSVYNDYMKTLYEDEGGVFGLAKQIANGEYLKTSTYADREAGLNAFLESQKLEGQYGNQYQSIAESLQKSLGEDVFLKYNSFETIEDFTRAIKDGTISLDGLSEKLKEITPEIVDQTHNINGNEFTNRVDISSDEEKFKDFLDDSGMTEGAFSRMSRDAYEEEGGYYQIEKQRLEDDIKAKEEYGIVTEKQKEEVEELRSELADLDDAAKDSTAMILRMSNGVVNLRNKFEDISEILTNEALKGTTEWYEALDDLDKGLSEVLNIDAGTLSDVFIESGEALDYARRMAEGDMTAIDDLRRAASEDIVQNLVIQEQEGQDVETVREQLLTELHQLQNEINSGAITVTADLDDKPFINKLNEMLKANQITAEQASNILSSIGMDAHLDYIEGDGEMPGIKYVAQASFDGPFPSVEFVPVATTIKGAHVKFPVIRGAHYTGSGVQTANTAASNPSYTGGYSSNPTPKTSSSSPKSKSSTPKQPKDNEKMDYDTSKWDYLTDITNDLDRAAAAMEKLSKLEDRLYGKDRISNLVKMKKQYGDYIGLLKQEVNLAKQHAKRLRTNKQDENGNLTVKGYANKAGIGLKFDKEGNIENGRQIETALLKKSYEATHQYNLHRNDENADEYKKDAENANKDYENFLKAFSEYEDTLGKIENAQAEIQENLEQIQDAADKIIDAIQDGLNDVMDSINNRRDFNRMYGNWKDGSTAGRFKNDIKYYSEGLASFFKSDINGKSYFEMQTRNLSNRVKDAQAVMDNNPNNADKEKLSQTDAAENLKEATEEVLKSLDQIINNYNSLLKVVEEASGKMDELIDKRLKEFDRLEKYLDTRFDQMILLFGDRNYQQQADFYNRRIEINQAKMQSILTAINKKQVTITKFEEMKELSEDQQKILDSAREEIVSLQEQQLDTETKILQDSQNRLKAQAQASLDDLAQQIFGTSDFDWMSQQWELESKYASKFLDDYNRAFEIQKLQLKYQDALNNNQNASIMTQQRISALMEEQLTFLREKQKVSSYDVQVAEKELQLLQKQIALEEAQNNKSQMRLQRNAAGNYDFVYAADEDQILKFKEEILATQQEIYNLSKNMAQKTTEDVYSTFQSLRDAMLETLMDMSLSVEERQARITYLFEYLKQYLGDSKVEISEIGVNLYNSFVEAEQLIADENKGQMEVTLQEMRANAGELKKTLEDNGNSTVSAITTNYGDIKTGYDQLLGDIESGTNKSNAKRIAADEKTLERIKRSNTLNYKDIEGIIFKTIANIDKRNTESWKLMDDNASDTEKSVGGTFDSLTKTMNYDINEVNKAADETHDDICGKGGYLDDFQSITEKTLEDAGDNYDTFVDDALENTKSSLDDINEKTVDWETDLDDLNETITDSCTAMESWKGWIDAAFTSIKDDLLPKATSLAEEIGKNETAAADAADSFDTFEDSTYNVTRAIDDMAYSIYNNYNSLADAALSAAGAYDNLADAASTAADAYRDLAAAKAEASGQSYNEPEPTYYEPTHYSVHIGDRMMFRTTDANSAYIYAQQLRNQWGNLVQVKIGQWDTGGYTGTWVDQGMDNKNGKLAILHKKELVLNATDTENMLTAVEIVRDITSGLNSLSSIGRTLSQTNTLNDTIKQRVEINATFPGVTEAIEIKQALEQLADNAYQAASRYKY